MQKKKKCKKKCKKKKNIWRCHHVKLVLQKTRSNDVFLLKIRSVTDILSFYVIFCCFTPLLTPEIKIGEKLKKHTKKTPRDVILLCRCTINQDHMMFISWFPRYKVERRKFFFIMVHFLPFNPPNDPKKQYFVVSRWFLLLN